MQYNTHHRRLVVCPSKMWVEQIKVKEEVGLVFGGKSVQAHTPTFLIACDSGWIVAENFAVTKYFSI